MKKYTFLIIGIVLFSFGRKVLAQQDTLNRFFLSDSNRNIIGIIDSDKTPFEPFEGEKGCVQIDFAIVSTFSDTVEVWIYSFNSSILAEPRHFTMLPKEEINLKLIGFCKRNNARTSMQVRIKHGDSFFTENYLEISFKRDRD